MDREEEPSEIEEEEESSIDFPEVPIEDDEAGSSNVEDVDSPESEDDYEDVSATEKSKGFEYSNINSPEGNSAMEGELDFEDEVSEHKSEICKEELDDVSKEAMEEEDNDTQDNETPTEKQNNAEDKDDDEEGECCSSPGKVTKDANKEGESAEEGEDDGEISDDDDLEEGEVKEPASSAATKQHGQQVCRFFLRGQCTWGTLCRFLHLSVGDKGNYNMFAPTFNTPPPFGNGMGMMPPPPHMIHGGPREFHPLPLPMPLPPPPPPINEPTPIESAWERGLRHAKELMKKASRRKEQEPDFEEKRLNLSLDDNEQIISEFEKENDFYGKGSYRRPNEMPPYNKYDEEEVFDNGEREARDHWRGGRYENIEIRWTRQDMQKNQRDRNRTKRDRQPSEPEKNFRPERPDKSGKWRDDRLSEVQNTRPRADEWRDPWRRSKTPKGRRSRSRGRSRGSYSSVSSHSYSERSSRSSYSYSRSSSRSSFYSSRSPSLNNKSSQKRKPQTRREPVPPVKVDRESALKRKPIILRRTQSRSYSRSRSSRSVSHSRSRSPSRTPSISRSKSYSRSLSMDSVSSASSSISRNSNHAVTQRNKHAHPPPVKKVEEPKPVATKPKPEQKLGTGNSLMDEMQRLRQYGRLALKEKSLAAAKKVPLKNVPLPPKEAAVPKKAETPAIPVPTPPPAAPPPQPIVAVVPEEDPQKEPPKQGLLKQQIKLTLLSKNLPSKLPNPLKKDSEAAKSKTHEKAEDKGATKSGGTKRPLSPSPKGSKRSTSSRRDELLKQLKAVEDAIARKRSKIV